jgi:hypothetical protein
MSTKTHSTTPSALLTSRFLLNRDEHRVGRGQAIDRCSVLNFPWHVRCSMVAMTVAIQLETSQTFDDGFFFQRLTLIDICCGPPIAA